MRDLLEELGNGVDGSLFADDLAIYTTAKKPKRGTRVLETWVAERGLKFSITKTLSMVFRKGKREKIN